METPDTDEIPYNNSNSLLDPYDNIEELNKQKEELCKLAYGTDPELYGFNVIKTSHLKTKTWYLYCNPVICLFVSNLVLVLFCCLFLLINNYYWVYILVFFIIVSVILNVSLNPFSRINTTISSNGIKEYFNTLLSSPPLIEFYCIGQECLFKYFGYYSYRDISGVIQISLKRMILLNVNYTIVFCRCNNKKRFCY